ncbi:MAG: heterocyst frequency control protein PatD [Leptolyngbyaceae cyanobacterium]
MSAFQRYYSAEADILSTFIQQLTTLQSSTCQANLDSTALQEQFLSVQQLYQQQLLPTLLASTSAEGLVTYQTEISRALRLLGMDVAFLQSARNTLTIQKRQTQMQQRLKSLLEFCQGLRAALSGADESQP